MYFLSIIGVLAIVLMLFLIKMRHSKKKNQLNQGAHQVQSYPEVTEFSGDNQWDTALDLAKAYLELNHIEKAKLLLKSIITQGDAMQIAEARKMFSALLKQERESKMKANIE